MDSRIKNYKYKFSVIIPVYNVEAFLSETIESIIEQTIGFKENIQLILVNDGSCDKSEEICLHYQQLFPANIVYVYKENGGVSSARNEGSKHINGKYVNYLDSDDKWKADAFEIVYNFFEKKYDEIDFVSCRYCFFGSKEGFIHPLDYKFGLEQIVDIEEEYSFIQLSVATTFIKAEALNNMLFDEKLDYSEDSKFMMGLVLKSGKYGIIPNAIYYYRKRVEQSSAMDTRFQNKSWYVDTIKYCYMDILDMSIAQYGEIIPYVQYQIMYDMKQRIPKREYVMLSHKEFEQYKMLIINILTNIDDFIILKQKAFSLENKLFTLKLKHGDAIYENLNIENGILTYCNMPLANLNKRQKLHVTDVKSKFGKLIVSGYHELECLGDEYSIVAIDKNDDNIPINFFDMPLKNKYAFDGTKTLGLKGFEIKIKAKKNIDISFMLKKSEGAKKEMLLIPKYDSWLEGLESKKTYMYKKYGIKDKKGSLNVFKRTLNRRIRSSLKKIIYNTICYRT